jgi:hypothetical protein
LNDWRFMVICTRWYCFFGGAMKAFFYLSRLGRGEWRGFCGSLITTSFLERIFFRHFHGVVQ